MLAACATSEEAPDRSEADAAGPPRDGRDGGTEADGRAPADAACVPRSCAELEAECGRVADGCGGMVDCGGCEAPARCDSMRCALPQDGTERSQLNYVVSAHPDDEMASWSLIEESPANYNIFIFGTRGEATGYCTPAFPGYDPDLGEAPPGNRADYEGQPCAELRIGSLHGFLSAMADVDDYIGPVPTDRYERSGEPLPPGTPGRECTISSAEYSIWPGRNSAIVFFDLGDGDLSPCEVEWAISQVRALRGTRWLPDLPEHSILAASYRNAVHDECGIYDHPDHRAVHRAVFNTDFGVPGPQYGRTCYTDPDASRTEHTEQYDAAMRVAPDGTREGHFQVYYGWLQGEAWPDAWRGGEHAFWVRFP